MKLSEYSISTKALWVIAVISLTIFFVSGRYFRSKVIDSDVVSYYSYLPAAFIEGDLKMRYAVGNDFYADKVWGVIWQENSGPVQKYTMGMSWLYLPFFLMGHVSANLLGFPTHGYSLPYSFWLQFSALFYLMLGLFWLRKILLQYFSEIVTTIVLFVVPFGTNLFFYTQGQAPMAHSYLFALISGLLWLTIRFYEFPTLRNAIYIGAICSLITLIRPNHLMLWMIPVFYGIYDRASFKKWWIFWKTHWWRTLTWPIILGIVILPQLFYWKYLTGNWVHYSYEDEHFFWLDPKIWQVLFSFRNGWIIYTPVMILAISGFFFMRKYAPKFSFILPAILLLSLYVISSWWCWWYGGAFGGRVFIDYYAMMAIALASLISYISERFPSRKIKIAGLSIFICFIALNLFQTFQYTRTILHHDSNTAQSYFSVFGKIHRPADLDSQLIAPDYEAAKKGIR